MLSKLKLYSQFFSLFLFFSVLNGIYLPKGSQANEEGFLTLTKVNFPGLAIMQQTTLLPLAPIINPKNTKKIEVMATAYSSSVDETDDTPFITASGDYVAEGIIANNGLPFGSLVKLPDLFGEKIFIVKDRMHPRKTSTQVDIWFPSKSSALKFGAKLTTMEILTD